MKLSRWPAVAVALAVARCAWAADAPAVHVEAGDRVAVLGDSITEQKNYSVLIEEYLLACQPAAGVQACQFGWGGETTWGLAPRLKQDVLWFKPTVATVNYGMNDGGYKPVDPKRLADYRDRTGDIIDQLRAAGCRSIVVGGPGAVDADHFATFIARGHDAAVMYNKTLATFADAAKQVAADRGVAYADLHGTMTAAMAEFKRRHPDKSFVGNDGIHPENVGHTVMAYAFLKAMGCEGDIGTVTLDLAAGRAEGTPGQQIMEVSHGRVLVTSTRWPFHVARDGDPLGIGAAMDLVPFMADLDRYTLVVRNPPAGRRLTVTWAEVVADGSDAKPVVVSRTFDADQLARGVNLADSFATTPFQHAWSRLDKAVHAQQEFETPLTKVWLHDQTQWAAEAPSGADAARDLATAAERFDGELRKVSAAAVVPVTYTLTVEPE